MVGRVTSGWITGFVVFGLVAYVIVGAFAAKLAFIINEKREWDWDEDVVAVFAWAVWPIMLPVFCVAYLVTGDEHSVWEWIVRDAEGRKEHKENRVARSSKKQAKRNLQSISVELQEGKE